MPLRPGTRFGAYEVVSALGAGGMGEVYRARDTRLDRDVALKILPEAVASDPDRLIRFEREAKTLASLNHPNIAAVYGLEEGALAMELVEGPTLDELIRAHRERPLPTSDLLDWALPIARQIADALEAAHEAGIVHRDLKPANVKVRADGTVKVLDFGLAKAMEPPSASGAELMNSPTLTARATQMGVILGTAAYMAPEQARGKAVDHRADIWAFGVVLYEMLTGRRAFEGEDISITLASVLKEDVRWDALPADLPPALHRLLRRCLERDPRRRLSSIGDARLELDERDEEPRGAVAPPTAASPRRSGRLVAAVAAAVVATAAVTWWMARGSATAPAAPRRVTVLPPAGKYVADDANQVALSPDGRRIAFVAGSSPVDMRLWIRDLDDLTPRAVEGSDGADQPFWSPDGSRVGFFAAGKLMTMRVDGGRPQAIADAPDGRGAAWSPEGVILFAPGGSGPLYRVSENGGAVTAATTLASDRGETGHRFPSFLPDGRHFLFSALPPKSGLYDCYLGSLGSTDRELVLGSESGVFFAPAGFLIYSRSGVLVARPFDASTRKLTGEAVPLGDDPANINSSWAAAQPASVSAAGDLAYLTAVRGGSRLAWLDQTGRETDPVDAPPGSYYSLSLSRDGRRAAVTSETGASTSIWLVDLARGGLTPFTTRATGWNGEPVWSPDGRRIAFSSDEKGPTDLYVGAADGSGIEPLYQSPDLFKHVASWSPDGRVIVFTSLSAETALDLWTLRLDDPEPRPFLQAPGKDSFGALSPDGRWMAYISEVAGKPDAYVRPFPGPGEAHRLTTDGTLDSELWWRADGRQILTVGADLELLLIDVTLSPEFSASPPRAVGRLRFAPGGIRSIDATPDLQRLLAIVPEAGTGIRSVTILQHWRQALPSQAR
jgi:Tol biopolymer transport system component/predicted Ser/Thr protein kinase